MARKPWFYGGISLKKLPLTGNDGYGCIGLWILSSKLVELAGKLVGVGRKMAKPATATWAHAPPTAHVAHSPVMKFQPWVHRQLLFLLIWQIHGGWAWTTVKNDKPWTGKMMTRERNIYIYVRVFFFFGQLGTQLPMLLIGHHLKSQKLLFNLWLILIMPLKYLTGIIISHIIPFRIIL